MLASGCESAEVESGEPGVVAARPGRMFSTSKSWAKPSLESPSGRLCWTGPRSIDQRILRVLPGMIVSSCRGRIACWRRFQPRWSREERRPRIRNALRPGFCRAIESTRQRGVGSTIVHCRNWRPREMRRSSVIRSTLETRAKNNVPDLRSPAGEFDEATGASRVGCAHLIRARSASECVLSGDSLAGASGS